jgi:DNA-binding response OmpR family regulator
MAAKAIAIIDDEIDLANLFKEVFENNALHGLCLYRLNEAFNYIKRNPNDYGLILLIIAYHQ